MKIRGLSIILFDLDLWNACSLEPNRIQCNLPNDFAIADENSSESKPLIRNSFTQILFSPYLALIFVNFCKIQPFDYFCLPDLFYGK